MYDRAERSDEYANPPDKRIVAGHIIKPPAKPDAQKRPDLMAEKDKAIKRPHIAQTIKMCDETAGQRNGREPELPHCR